MTEISLKPSVMIEAEGLVNGARAAAYGHPMENFKRICALWNAYLQGKYGHDGYWINEEDHAILMILVKIARLEETPNHRDSLVDICGYAGTYEKVMIRRDLENAAMNAAYALLAQQSGIEED